MNKNYNKNNDYFQNINNENKAYILGFISADGHISTKRGNQYLNIEIQKRDEKILRFIKKEIEYSGPIKKTIHNKKEYSRIRVYGKNFTNHIISHGLDSQKSNTLQFPKSIPECLINHYIRGLFDGDGCLYVAKRKNKKYVWSLSIISTQMVNNYICDYIEKKIQIKFKKNKIKNNKNISIIKLEKYKDIEYFLDYLYDNSNIYLNRKYKTFLRLKKIKQKNELKLKNKQKLREDQVRIIKSRLKNKNESYRKIAKDFNVSHGVIQSIANNRNYKWII